MGFRGAVVGAGRGRALDATVRDHGRGRDDDDVGLDDVMGCEDDVDGGDEDFCRRAKVIPQGAGETEDQALMGWAGRRRHVDLPVDQLIAVAAGRNGAVVAVVEPYLETGFHG